MFEEKTYDSLLDEYLSLAPKDIDTRPGSIYYDAGAGIMLIITKLYTDLDVIKDTMSVMSATGEMLDKCASEDGIIRLPASNAKYYVEFSGVQPMVGERFFCNGLYFTLSKNSEGEYILESEEAGEAGNVVTQGTAAIPVNSIDGLESAVFGSIFSRGSEAESDESLRQRVQEKKSGPAENGNKQHYKTWCESRVGVGAARIFPQWNGPNTVKAVLIGSDGYPCTSDTVKDVQNYIDPNTQGYTTTVDGTEYVVGDGLGEGVANLGAHFTAVAARAVNVSISFKPDLRSGATNEMVVSEAEEAIGTYLKKLVLTQKDDELLEVRLSAIGAIVYGLNCITDYSDLKINNLGTNMVIGNEEVPILAEVVVI